MILVVDASTVTKWWRPEVFSDEAAALQNPALTLIAPDILPTELASIATQWTRRRQVPEMEAALLVFQLPLLPIELFASGRLLNDAHRLAVHVHPSVYDCLYLAVALQSACPLVTADRELYRNAHRAHPEAILWIADLPAYLDGR